MIDDDNWQAECDMRALEEADAIRNDNERMRRARAAAQEHIARMHKIAEPPTADLEKGYTSLGKVSG